MVPYLHYIPQLKENKFLNDKLIYFNYATVIFPQKKKKKKEKTMLMFSLIITIRNYTILCQLETSLLIERLKVLPFDSIYY